MVYHMSTIAWTVSSYCWVALLIPIIICCVFYRAFFTLRVVKLLAGTRTRTLIAGFSPLKVWLRALLSIVAVLLMAVALFQPRWGNEVEQITQEGRDLLIAFDISRSMLAKD